MLDIIRSAPASDKVASMHCGASIKSRFGHPKSYAWPIRQPAPMSCVWPMPEPVSESYAWPIGQDTNRKGIDR